MKAEGKREREDAVELQLPRHLRHNVTKGVEKSAAASVLFSSSYFGPEKTAPASVESERHGCCVNGAVSSPSPSPSFLLLHDVAAPQFQEKGQARPVRNLPGPQMSGSALLPRSRLRQYRVHRVRPETRTAEPAAGPGGDGPGRGSAQPASERAARRHRGPEEGNRAGEGDGSVQLPLQAAVTGAEQVTHRHTHTPTHREQIHTS